MERLKLAAFFSSRCILLSILLALLLSQACSRRQSRDQKSLEPRTTQQPTGAQQQGIQVSQAEDGQWTMPAKNYASTRFAGAQFEDDQNRFRLGRYFVLDALVSKPIARSLELFGAVQNLFNQKYEIGRTPTTTLGPPRLLRVGLRLRLGAQ